MKDLCKNPLLRRKGKKVYIINQHNKGEGIPTLNLVAYYPFNGNANDESGNGNNGTVSGATLTTDRNGNIDSAYVFNNQYIEITKISDWDALFTGDFTFSMWIYPTTLPSFSRLLGFRDGAADGIEFLLSGSSVINCNYNNATSDGFSETINLNEWNNIIFIKESDIFRMYYNNVLNGTTFDYSLRGSIDVAVNPRIANFATSSSFGLIGKMDDLAIYSRAVSESERDILSTF